MAQLKASVYLISHGFDRSQTNTADVNPAKKQYSNGPGGKLEPLYL